MILKALLVLAVIGVVYFLFIKKPSLGNTTKTKKKDDKLNSNDMVECTSCGVYVEVSEAILSNGKYYCSKECVTQG